MIDGDFSVALGLAKPTRRRQRVADPVDHAHRQLDALAMQADGLRTLMKAVAVEPKPRDVHHLRTTIRRLETLLPDRAGEPTRAERKLQKQLDKIRKRAGKVRDVDVHLRALASLETAVKGDEYEQLRGAVQKTRTKRRKRLLAAIADERDRRLSRRLRQVVDQASRDGHVSADDPLVRALREFAELWSAVADLGEQDLHEFRLRAKRLRYLAETATPGKEAAIAVAQLKRIQDAAGAWHDWVSLASRAAKEVGGDTPSPLLEAIRRRTDTQLQKALVTVASAGSRLIALQPAAPRKPARPMSPARAPQARNAGASA
jgi:CHAD domain-containing protein